MKKVLIFLFVLIGAIKANQKILFVDTSNNLKYQNRTLQTLTKSVGFETDFTNICDFQNKNLDPYDGIFLLVDYLFLLNLESSVSQYFISKIKEFKNLENKFLFIGLPKIRTFPEILIENSLDLMIQLSAINEDDVESFVFPLNVLLRPNSYRSFLYDTALIVKRDIEKDQKLKNIKKINNQLLMLPIKYKSSRLKNIYPIGIYKDNLFITKISLFSIADLDEDFTLVPTDLALRDKFLSNLHETLFELKLLLDGKNLQEISKAKKPNLPYELTSNFIVEQKNKAKKKLNFVDKKYKWIEEEKVSCGWTYIDLDCTKEELEREIDLIEKSGLNLLWLELNPELYLGEDGIKKELKGRFLSNLSLYTKILKEKYEKSNKELPKLFVGVELTGNFAKKIVGNPLVDFYGKEYDKIPSPFDYNNFWKTQLLEPLAKFLDEWKLIGNGLPISGVFLDFEMYHATDQLASFIDMSDFSDIAWNIYCQKIGKKFIPISYENRGEYLFNNNELKNYFEVLGRVLKVIGFQIRKFIQNNISDGMIAVYYPVLLDSWIYKNLFSGLSSIKDPIILATFNNDFYSHFEWLKNQKIYAYHIPVIMLSKFRNKKDFNIISTFRNTNDGVWYNRFFWLKFGFNKEPDFWAKLEQTKMDSDLVAKEIRNYSKKKRAFLPSF
jgi:hypothetical protein